MSTNGASAAFFDVDGTLVRSNVVTSYFYAVGKLEKGRSKWLRVARAWASVPRWLWLDRVDRSRFNREFFQVYGGMSHGGIRRLFRDGYEEYFGPRLIASAVERARVHRERGDRLVLLSGSPDFIVRPLAERLGAQDCLCPTLAEDNGLLTGEMKEPALAGSAKAEAAREYAARHGIELSACSAYADSLWDAPLLEVVGEAVAVRPDKALSRLAVERGWEVLAGA
jgi:HAD superfamily hydrolase (TIGR01490 family)